MSHELLPYLLWEDVRRFQDTYFLHLHLSLLNALDIDQMHDPYWEYTTGAVRMYESFTRGDFRVDIGPIGAFSQIDASKIVQATLDSYIAQGTFGNFSIGDAEYWRLMSVLVSGFDEERIVVRVEDKIYGSLVGGCMVVPGKSKKKIGELIGSPEATLPTLSALSFDIGTHPSGQVTEQEAVCFSRYFHVPDAYLLNSDPSYRVSLSKEILLGMVMSASRLADFREIPFQFGIVDTHDSHVSETMEKHYAGEVVARNVFPSDLVKAPHPLHWHYDMPGIAVLAFPFEEMHRLVKGYDRQMGEKQPLLSNGATNI